MTRFDWRTEDENEALSAPAPRLGRLTRRPGNRTLLVIGLAIVSLVAVATWQIRRQAAQHTRQVEADLLAGFGLWQRAVGSADPDLFDTLLVGAEPSWQEFQRRMLARGLTLNRPLLGLRLADPGPFAPSEPQVTLSPDWRTAEVAFDVVYRVAESTGELVDDMASDQALIELEQRLIFDQIGQRWVLARPGDDFWGERLTIETDYLTLSFYEPDAEFAGRFVNDLEQELAGLVAACPQPDPEDTVGACGPMTSLNLHLAIEPELWLDATTLANLPLYSGRQQLLPSPSVVGRPVDEAGYGFLYNLYSANLVASFQTRLAAPIALPEQVIAVACFPESRSGQRLFLYDPSRDSWEMVRTEYAFRQFSPLPDDSGLVIEQHVSASESTGLRLRIWTGQNDRLLYDAPDFSRLMTVPFGWATPVEAPHLLLHGFNDLPQATRYRQLDLSTCNDDGCTGQELPGYTAWSPDGRQAIIMIENELYLGSDQDLGMAAVEIQAQRIPLGPGFSPFWLDNQRFGFARYLEQEGRLAVEVMLASVADPQPRQLLAPTHLTTAAGYRWPDQPVFVNYLFAHPGQPDTLFISGVLYSQSSVNQGDSRQFRLFSVKVPPGASRPADSLALLLSLDGVPASYPSMLNASGSIPFSISPDGRWVLLTQVTNSVPAGWPLYLYDVESDRLLTYTTDYPPQSFRYSFFDWSADGQWLVVVDSGFLHLIAPGFDYEQKIPLEQPACGYIAWLDRD